MNSPVYRSTDINNPEAQKVIQRLEKLGTIPKGARIEFLIGQCVLWGLDPCVIGTDNALITFNNRAKTIVPIKKVYPYATITGFYIEQAVFPKLCLALGGAKTEELDINFSAYSNEISDFLSEKITA